MRKYLCISNYCRIFASEKETNNKLNPKTRKGTTKMKTYNNINEISDAEVLAILDGCMSNIFDEEKAAKREAKKAARRAQRETDFQECIRFCERARYI